MSDIEKFVENLKCWSGPVIISRIDGGISNDNFLVKDGKNKYVARINEDVPVHGVLRVNDYNCNRAAAVVGVAPDVHHYENGALIVKYVESQTLSEENIRDDRMLERILDLIQRTHHDAFRQIRGPVCAFWPFRICRDYAFFLEENDSRMKPKLSDLRKYNDELEAAIGAVDLVLGHNDLLAANFLDDGNRLWLIDWEHAGFSSPYFDLANLASNNGLSDKQQNWLLEAYFDKTITEEMQHRFLAMSCASLLREAMWSMVSEIHSSLDFDYITYSNDFYGRFEKAYSDFKEVQ